MTPTLRHILAVSRRERSGYYRSPVAYVFLFFFLLLAGVFTFKLGGFFAGNDASLHSFFNWLPWLCLLLVPAIGMRLWSEERRVGTLELLLTLPITGWQAVLGKYLAALHVLTLAIALTFPLVLTVLWLGNPDLGAIAGGYLGAFLLAGAFLAVSSVASALTRNQVVSFILAVAACLFLLLAGWPPVTGFLVRWAPLWLLDGVAHFSAFPHFDALQRGRLELRGVLYFLSLTLLGLFTTAVLIRGRVASRWHAAAGVALMATLLLFLNLLAGRCPARLDLTAEKLHTLTPATRQILQSLDHDLNLRFYRTLDSATVPVATKAFARRVEDTLREYQSLAHGHLQLQLLDPAPDSEAADSAELDGVAPTFRPDGEPLYLGLAVQCLDLRTTLPTLAPERAGLLEHDLTTAITRVLNPVKPTLGIVSPLPVLGRAPNPMFAAAAAAKPWGFIQELQRDCQLQEIPAGATTLPANLQALILIHPRDLPEATLRAIDRYLRGGGRVIAFLDPVCLAESYASRGSGPPPAPSSLDPLLAAWGVTFARSQVAADLTTRLKGTDDQGKIVEMPTVLLLTPDQFNRADPATAQLAALLLPLPGWFENAPVPGLHSTVLLQSSERSGPVPAERASRHAEVLSQLQTDGRRRTLALRLDGRFPSAFPPPPPGQPDASMEPVPAKPGMVTLVADADLLFDPFANSAKNVNDNFDFARNLIDLAVGDPRLVTIRSRGAATRPFTRVARIQAAAEDAYRADAQALEQTLAELRGKLQGLKLGQDRRVTLTAEQKTALESFQRQYAEAMKKQQELRRKLRRDVDRLETRLEWLNTAAMPALVAAAGLLAAALRRRRPAATRPPPT